MQHPYPPQLGRSDPLSASPGPRQSLPGPDQIAGLTIALVGREAALQQLIDRFSQLLRHGGVQMLTIIGPMGVGKSRLAAELQQFAAELLDPVPFVYLRADQGDSAPDSLLRQLVAVQLDRLGCEVEADPLGALEQSVELLLGDGSAEAAHFIGHLLGYDLSASPYLRGILGDARQIRARALLYLGLCLQAASTQTPLVLVADHLHAADESSLDALAYLAEEVPGANVLICGLAQPELLERRPGWGGARIELAPLDRAGSRRLVADILRLAAPLPEGLADLIADQAQGNPLLIYELVNTLIADQIVLPGPERWQIRPGWQGRLRSAQTLAGLLEARLRALSPDKQTLLRYAAVVGTVFWADAALALIPPELRPADPDALLASLEAQLLIVRQLNSGLPGQRVYRFQQELLRCLAYAQHPPEGRAGLHLALADWLLAHGAAHQPSSASLIAAQYERGGEGEQAGRWYARAAYHAHAIFARAEAIGYLGHALRLLPDLPDYADERLGCALKLAELYASTNHPAESLETYDTVHAVAVRSGDLGAEATVLEQRSKLHFERVALQPALEDAQQAVALAERHGDDLLLARCLERQGWIEMRLDQPQIAIELSRRVREIGARHADSFTAARGLLLAGIGHAQSGAFALALDCLNQSLMFHLQLGNSSEVIMALNNLGYVENVVGDYQHALDHLDEAERLSRAIGDRTCELYVLSNLCITQVRLGRVGEAEASAQRGILITEHSGRPAFFEFYQALVEAHLGQGRINDAVAEAQRSLELTRGSGSLSDQGVAWRVLALAISGMDDPQGAAPCFAESARLLELVGPVAEHGRTLRAWALYELRHGDPALACSLWQQARAIFAGAGLHRELERTAALPS
jgi:predicted ATPase